MELIQPTNRPDPLREGLVLPAYRQFCRDYGLNIQDADVGLTAEAIELFNQVKPHYIEFRGKIVNYRMVSAAGDFERTVQPIKEFLGGAAIVEARCQNLERWFGIAADAIVLSAGLVLKFVIDRVTKEAWPGWVALLAVAVTGRYAWKWFFVTRPMLAWMNAQTNLQIKLERLRQKAAGVASANLESHRS